MRTTSDLDILLNANEENADKMLMVMLRFGYGPYDFELKDFLLQDTVVSIGKEPIKIEILMSTLGVTFEECYRNRHVIEVEGVPVNFISLPDLIKNKRAVGRPKDLLDLDNLPPGA